MQLTRHTDYALRVLIYLALHIDRKVTINEIAGKYGVSENHLIKVVHGLGIKGFVRTFRGKGGGICLNHPAEDIRIGAVVRASEANLKVIDCNSPYCPLSPACALQDALAEATNEFFKVLDRYTLADIVKDPGTLLRLVG